MDTYLTYSCMDTHEYQPHLFMHGDQWIHTSYIHAWIPMDTYLIYPCHGDPMDIDLTYTLYGDPWILTSPIHAWRPMDIDLTYSWYGDP